tara:strand:+ start:184 stop:390 length:207 start_codon:yes stop_codon:yes gene_type:complete
MNTRKFGKNDRNTLRKNRTVGKHKLVQGADGFGSSHEVSTVLTVTGLMRKLGQESEAKRQEEAKKDAK